MSAYDYFSGIEYFRPHEFFCPCCRSLGDAGIATDLLELLDRMRREIGQPIYIASGYRCPEHNAAVGGVARSQHLTGRAADIYVKDDAISVDALAWLALAMSDGGHHIGLGRYYESDYIHIDVRGYEARW